MGGGWWGFGKEGRKWGTHGGKGRGTYVPAFVLGALAQYWVRGVRAGWRGSGVGKGRVEGARVKRRKRRGRKKEKEGEGDMGLDFVWWRWGRDYAGCIVRVATLGALRLWLRGLFFPLCIRRAE